VLAGKLIGKQREQGRADTNENVGAKPSRAVLRLALKADDTAEHGCNQ